MFGNVTALESWHVAGKYEDMRMQLTCPRHAAGDPHNHTASRSQDGLHVNFRLKFDGACGLFLSTRRLTEPRWCIRSETGGRKRSKDSLSRSVSTTPIIPALPDFILARR